MSNEILDLLEKIRAYITLEYWESATEEISKLDDLVREKRGW